VLKDAVSRMAFMQHHLGLERALLAETANSRARARIIADTLNFGTVPKALADNVVMGSRLEKVAQVRAAYLTREMKKLGASERDALSLRMGEISAKHTSWSEQLPHLRARLAQQSPEGLLQAVKDGAMRDFERGRTASPVPGVEALQAWFGEASDNWQTLGIAIRENKQAILARLLSPKEWKRGLTDIIWVNRQSGTSYERAKRIVDRLQAQAGSLPAPIDFKVVQRSEPNARGGAGKVLINEGLMEKFSDDQLASILGHEIAHVRHGDSTGVAAVRARQKKWMIEKKQELPQPVLNELIQAYQDAWKVIRDRMELEADADGLRYMARAGFEPGAALEAMATQIQSSNRQADHPESAVRLLNLLAVIQKEGLATKSAANR
jgi:hypothetical protein